MRKIGKPNGEIRLLFTYDADHNNHIVYSVGADEAGNYYSVEEHEYHVGSAYSVYRDYYLLEDLEVEGLRQKAIERETQKADPLDEDASFSL